MENDLKIKKFHFRARALIVSNGLVLLAHRKGAANTYLPGGHIELGEGARKALEREIREEIGVTGVATDFLGVIEHAYMVGAIYHQEISLVFLVKASTLDSRIQPPAREPHLEFFWRGPADLERENPQPGPLVRLIRDYLEERKTPRWASTLEQ